VTPVPGFLQDLKYLSQLMDADTPPRQLYQAKHSTAWFVIGDASGRAKGAVVVYQHGLDYELGTWLEEWRGKSSNVREAKNLTDRLKRLAAESVGLATQVVNRLETLNTDNALADHEVFVLTDNSAFEGSYYKGHSTSRELSDIVFGTAGRSFHTTCPTHLRQEDEGYWCGWPVKRGPHRGDNGGQGPNVIYTVPPRGRHKVTGQGGKVGSQLVEDKQPSSGLRARMRLGGPLPGGSQPGFELKNVKAAKLWMLPPHSYGGGHRAVVGGQAGTPPVASRVCCTSFHDPHVAEGLRKKRRHTFHCADGHPALGSLTV